MDAAPEMHEAVMAGNGRLRDHHAQEWERTYAMFTHLSLIAAHVVPVVPTLILWLVKRDQSPFIDDHGKEAINFQISLILYFLLGLLLIPLCGIGGFVIAGVYILGIVGMILAAVASNRGEYYRYPVCVRLIR